MYALIDITIKKKEGLDSCTSKDCLWNQPARSRKLSPKKVSDLTFKKQKLSHSPPRNPTLHKPSSSKPQPTPINIERFGKKLQAASPHAAFLLSNKLTVYMFQRPPTPDKCDLGLPTPPFMYRDSVNLQDAKPQVAFEKYLTKLCATTEQCVAIEFETRKQSKNKNWEEARSDRITSSTFGLIFKRKNLTRPDSILKTVLGYYSKFDCESLRWGRSHEPAARRRYVKQTKREHPGLTVTECGLLTVPEYPYLGSSPDGLVHCPHCDSLGVLEIKCPYKYRMVLPLEAATNKDFCCEISNGLVKLKRHHTYYFQVQGQMGITGRKWCHFVIWTLGGCTVEKIEFDDSIWKLMLLKLTSFFREYVVPELFTRRVRRGIKL